MEGWMIVYPEESKTCQRHTFLDYLLYILAGGAFAAISCSFLLWLGF